MKRFALSIGTLILVQASVVWAQPVILGVEGTFEHGQEIVITGNLFGSKAQAAPLLWDDFENGVAGAFTDRPGSAYANRPHGPVMYNDGSPGLNGPNVSLSAYSGDLFLHNRRQGAGAPQYPNYNLGGFNAAAFVLPEPTDEIYVSYYWRYDVYSEDQYNYSVVKQARVIGEATNFYSGPGRIMSSALNIELPTGPSHAFEDGTWLAQRGGNPPAKGEWQRVELYKKNSDPGVSNGVVWTTAGGVVILDMPNVMTKVAGSTWQQESVNLGMMMDTCAPNPATGVADCDIMQSVDDFYIDTTFARVELGNAPSFDACTRREIQIPTVWSSGSIAVRFNTGSFSASEQVYLFVINGNRQRSAGFPVIIGADNDQGAPGAPGIVTFD